MTDVAITEFEEIDPDSVHFVKRGANGFPVILAKAVEEEVALAMKADGSEEVIAIADIPAKLTEIEAAQKASADAEAKLELHLNGTKVAEAVGDVRSQLLTVEVAAKADDDTKRCPTCKGSGKVKANTTKCPDCQGDGKVASDFGKADAEKDLISGVNPVDDVQVIDPSDPANIPGSPVWEQADADCMTDAATQLVQAANKIKGFLARESAEVDAGEMSDINDVWDAERAIELIMHATGISARLALQEAAEATKEVAEKAGKRLSTKSVSALAAARDHLNSLLGDDDPAKSKEDDASKQSGEDILDMTKDELIKLLDERDEARRVAKKEHKAEKAAKAAEATAEQGIDPDAVAAAEAAKAAADEIDPEAAPEEDAAKAEVTINPDVTKALEEIEDLKAKVEAMGKMAAPGGPVKTRNKEQITKAAERDTLIQEAEVFERRANDTSDPELRKGYTKRAKDLRAKAEAA